REAILDGFSKSAFIVVAAAAIMAAVFGGFALSPSTLVASFTLGTTVGVNHGSFVRRLCPQPLPIGFLHRIGAHRRRHRGRVFCPHGHRPGGAGTARRLSVVDSVVVG